MGNKKLGVLFAFVGAVGQGIGFVLAKYGMTEAGGSSSDLDPLSATLIRMIAACIFIWIVIIASRNLGLVRSKLKERKSLKLAAGGAFFGPFIGVWMSMVALSYAIAGVAATLMSLMPVIVIPVLWIVYKQKTNMRGIAGAMIAVVGVAILIGFSSGLLILSGTWMIMVVGFFIRRMPYIFRSTTASLSQIDAAVEEASTIAGAPWFTTFRRITLPLMAPGILAGAVISFSTLMGELSTTVILFSAKWKTISVAIVEYLFSATIGPAYALGTILIVLVLTAIYLANRILGRTMSQMFKMV